MQRSRRQRALDIRVAAAELAYGRYHPEHRSNGDEAKFSGEGKYLASFTKGLPHDATTGLIENEADFEQFVAAIESGNPNDFINTPLGPNNNPSNPVWRSAANNDPAPRPVRAWESQGAGQLFTLDGPDAQAVTMPPAPALGSDELTAEIAEVYLQALLRDTPFNTMMSMDLTSQVSADTSTVNAQISKLNQLPWFQDAPLAELSQDALQRRRGPQELNTVFRGVTRGDDVGPYLSQFLLAGNQPLGDDGVFSPKDGYIAYGSIRIDQRVRTAIPYLDYMETWNEWLDVQNGVKLDQKGMYDTGNPYRFIATPRDLATYVHNDALYEAYLNACLMMLNAGVPLDEGIPYTLNDAEDHQQGFAHFGGPHILTLVTEVATRALKAVRYQKFNLHRRLRPEALAGRLEKMNELPMGADELGAMCQQLTDAGVYAGDNRLAALDGSSRANRLLPMAFREGSPMHPSYGAGHATVAGACVTLLKAFFDHNHVLNITGEGDLKAFVPKPCGSALDTVDLAQELTVEGELNKLASNISIGRDWAGVHYFSDYLESIRLGEAIAIGMLAEQKLTYHENFRMTIPLFDGGYISI